MFNKIYSNDEPSALAFVISRMAVINYRVETQMIRRQTIDLTPLFHKGSDAAASFFRGDLPAALAYETNQMVAADFRRQTCPDEKGPSFFEKVSAWVMRKPAPAPRLVNAVSC